MPSTIKCNEGGPYPWDFPALVTDRNPACGCGHAQWMHAGDDCGWHACGVCDCREFCDEDAE